VVCPPIHLFKKDEGIIKKKNNGEKKRDFSDFHRFSCNSFLTSAKCSGHVFQSRREVKKPIK